MEEIDEMQDWCQKNNLSEDTYQVLRQEGFTSLEFVRLLTTEQVDKWMKQPRLLPLAQSLALQHAVALLTSGSHGQAAGPNGVTPGEAMEAASPPGSPIPTPDQGLPHLTTAGTSTQLQASRGVRFSASAESCNSSYDDAEEDAFPVEQYRFLLVGKTGSGKSTTGNSILGADLFDEDVAFDSQTNRSQLKRRVVDGKYIEIMDSPGLFDTHRSHEEISVDIVKAVACMHPGPHAILYVIRLGRYTKEEYEVYTRLKALFDEHVTRFVIVVFTGGDGLEKEGKDIEEVLQKVPQSLHQVLQECQHRVVVFNNVVEDRRPYVRALLQQVQFLTRSNGGSFYTCPRYAEVGKGVEEEVALRLQEMEKEQLANSPFVQELKEKATSAEEELQEGRRLFDQREQERQQETTTAEARAEAEMQALLMEMRAKDYSMEQQRAEKDKLLDRHEREREERRKNIERQREQEAKELEQREKEFKVAVRKAEEEQRRFLQAKKRVYERKIAQMKENIAKDKEDGFVDKIVGKIKGVIESITSIVPTIASLFGGGKKD